MIRIIAGSLRGRKLEAPAVKTTRPTTDRVRESIFNVLESRLVTDGLSFENLVVLDAFAGSGALGIEALSRGGKFAIFFEQNPAAYSALIHNLRLLGLDQDQVKSYRCDATKPPKTDSLVNVVFLDPPYGKNLIHHCVTGLQHRGWVDESTLYVAEMDVKDELPEKYAQHILVSRTYGTTKVELFRLPKTLG